MMQAKKWTKQETEYLKTYYGRVPLNTIAAELRRTKQAVISKATRLGIRPRRPARRWARSEIVYLRQHYKRMPTQQIAERLNRSANAVRAKARYEGLARSIPKPKWSQEELDFLKANYSKLTNSQIAKQLGRTFAAVKRKTIELGLYRKTLAEQKATALKVAEAAYIAGFIDGEGSVRFNIAWRDGTPIRAVPAIEISNKDKAVLDWIAEKLVVSGRWKTRATYKNPERRYGKPYYHYHLTISGRARLKPALLAILPYLRVKRPQAEAILEFIDTHETGIWTEHDWRLVLKVRELTASKKAPHIKQVERLRAWIEAHYGTSSN